MRSVVGLIYYAMAPVETFITLLNTAPTEGKQKLIKQNEVLPRQPAGGAEFRAFAVPPLYGHLAVYSCQRLCRWAQRSLDESAFIENFLWCIS